MNAKIHHFFIRLSVLGQTIQMQLPSFTFMALYSKRLCSYSATQRAVHKLNLKPYKIRAVHKLKPTDPTLQVAFCSWLLCFIDCGINPLDITFFSDNAYFWLTGYVNRQNNCYWAIENPHVEKEVPLHLAKIVVWLRFHGNEILIPFFFALSIDSMRYCDVIEQSVVLLEPEERYCW